MALQLNHIYNGDCVERLAELTPGSIDLVFADPPFNIGYEYDVYEDEKSRDDYLAWSRRWLSGVFRCLKSSGTFWLAIGDEFAAELKMAAQYDVGFHCRSWVIWYYTFGVNCARGFSRSHTHLFHFVKDRSNFVFNGDNPTVRVASARQLVYADGRANPKGRLPDNTWILRPQDAPGSFAPRHDTWYFARVAGTFKERQGFHGCQMPEQLMGRIIRISSNPRDVVLDPFSGSGTTLAVAKKLGRQWLGFELSAEYASRIDERIKKILPGDALDGSENPLASAPTTPHGKKKLRVHKGRPVPSADPEIACKVRSAFERSSDGFSADHLLCDPELARLFVQECKRQDIPGSEFVWNRILLRLRKSGKLPKAVRPGMRGTLAEMDAYSFASEIAWRLLEIDYGLTLDDIFCHPEAVLEFDRIAQDFAPGYSPFAYRWAALALRKRAVQAKTMALSMRDAWRTPLPRSKELSAVQPTAYDGCGVYVVANPAQTLYVGATLTLSARIEHVQSAECWARLGATTIRVVPADENSMFGIQSILIHRTNPLMNAGVLRPKLAGHSKPRREPAAAE